MSKFRKKPIVVDAVEFTQKMADSGKGLPDGVICNYVEYAKGYNHGPTRFGYAVKTLEGDMKVKIGDYIVTGIRDEKYCCDREIFFETYEQFDG